MATGGGVCCEELDSFELFECSVCLEFLIKKQPRLLSCGHTFCTPCLQRLSGIDKLYCPKCRSPTKLPVPVWGAQALPKNTDIVKFWEREQELLSARYEPFCQMCKKKDARVVFFCMLCPKGQICQACYNIHRKIPSLKQHKIFSIEKKIAVYKDYEKCKFHGEVLEHFCVVCEEPICVTCMCDDQHKEHYTQIVKIKPNPGDDEFEKLDVLSVIKPGGYMEMNNPLEVVSVGDGTVILVDYNLDHLQRINIEGNVVKKYKIMSNQHDFYYNSACVFGNSLFVASSFKFVTKISLDGSVVSAKCQPIGVRKIRYISAIGDNVTLISEGGYVGRILEYNIESKQVTPRVTDINNAGKVRKLNRAEDTKYIVKCFNFGWRVNVFNRSWNLISTIDIDPNGLTVTPGGKLFFSDRRRIHYCSQYRSLIREISGKYHLCFIQDITYSVKCLWVLERDPHCIKILYTYEV